MIDARTLRADFRGGVLASCMQGTRARFFSADREIRAKVLVMTADASGRCTSALLRVAEGVPPGTIGMFDVTPARVSGKRLHSRACDDLAGAAATLTMLAELAAKPAMADVGVLLTRGEEEGFIGAIAACQQPKLLRKDDRVISVECSAEQPVARQGEGVVLRIGDRTSIFNSAFSRFIFDCALALASREKRFRYQRALMPGGTCEATTFDAWGYCAAALCVPLGNYHNMDRERERIAAEHVHLDDWRNMVRLFVEVARAAHTFSGSHEELRQRLTARFETHRHQLTMRGTVHGGS
jgi:endoglucanase